MHLVVNGNDLFKEVEIGATVMDQITGLPGNRFDFPFRSMMGRVSNETLSIRSAMSYSDHVAILVLHSLWFDSVDAAMMVDAGNAGAVEGDMSAFERWRRASNIEEEGRCVGTLPDNSSWTVWWRKHDRVIDRVPLIMGWINGAAADLSVFDALRAHTCH